jgi:hypothetical protein
MKSYIFWAVTPCSPLKINRHFGGTCNLHLQGRGINQARNQYGAGGKQSSGFGLFYYPEDGGDMFLRNIG